MTTEIITQGQPTEAKLHVDPTDITPWLEPGLLPDQLRETIQAARDAGHRDAVANLAFVFCSLRATGAPRNYVFEALIVATSQAELKLIERLGRPFREKVFEVAQSPHLMGVRMQMLSEQLVYQLRRIRNEAQQYGLVAVGMTDQQLATQGAYMTAERAQRAAASAPAPDRFDEGEVLANRFGPKLTGRDGNKWIDEFGATVDEVRAAVRRVDNGERSLGKIETMVKRHFADLVANREKFKLEKLAGGTTAKVASTLLLAPRAIITVGQINALIDKFGEIGGLITVGHAYLGAERVNAYRVDRKTAIISEIWADAVAQIKAEHDDAEAIRVAREAFETAVGKIAEQVANREAEENAARIKSLGAYANGPITFNIPTK